MAKLEELKNLSVVAGSEDDDNISKSSLSVKSDTRTLHSQVLGSRKDSYPQVSVPKSSDISGDVSANTAMKSSRKEMLQILLGHQMIKLCGFII